MDQLFNLCFYFSHNSPFYLPSRGQCLCYSGQFICAKPDYNKGRKGKPQGEEPVGEGFTVSWHKTRNTLESLELVGLVTSWVSSNNHSSFLYVSLG